MIRIIDLAVLFVIGVNAMVFSAQERKERTLSVSVRSIEKAYSIKGNIHLEIQLENVGSESVLVPRNWDWGVGRTDVQVYDVNGKQVFTNFIAEEFRMPREEDFIELKPSEFFGIHLTDRATHFVNSAGGYHFLVEYNSDVSEKWAQKYLRLPRLPLWSSERGAIVSNKVRVEVTE